MDTYCKLLTKEPRCIDDGENSHVFMFPSGGQAPSGAWRWSLYLSPCSHNAASPSSSYSRAPLRIRTRGDPVSLDIEKEKKNMLMLPWGMCQEWIINNDCKFTALIIALVPQSWVAVGQVLNWAEVDFFFTIIFMSSYRPSCLPPSPPLFTARLGLIRASD